jgi:GntP family gluconate:H+ symporter
MMNPHSISLLLTAAAAILILIILIAKVKLHPFLALLLVSIGLGIIAGMPLANVVRSFEGGVGTTLGHVAVVIALGTMLGKMMADSGKADRIAETLIGVFGIKHIQWAMLLIGIITGLPVFFEVGFVLLIPIAFTVARRSGVSLLLVALPMLAGLSVVHAFIPPHPAALAAVVIYNANIGQTIGFALLIGIPAAVLAGPLFGKYIAEKIQLPSHNEFAEQLVQTVKRSRTPSFTVTLLTILLPVLLMLIGGWADKVSAVGSKVNASLHLIGSADMSLLIGVLVGFVTFGLNLGFTRQQLLTSASDSLPPTANAILLIGAGGGFGRILQDSNISSSFVELAQHSHMPILFTAWLLAALIRLATGSSTVAMTTAAGIIAPLALHSTNVRPELLVIATGAGSIIFSHVNDGGFWLEPVIKLAIVFQLLCV